MILRRTRPGSAAFIAFSCLAAGAAGQTPALTVAQKAAAIDTVRQYALSYTASLPDYTCTQSTRKTITSPAAMAGGPPGFPLRVDRIEEQLSFVNRGEVRTVTKINDAPPSAAGRAQMGAVPRGEFGNLLDTIFDPKTAADIRWDRAAALEGRRVYVFAYRVPQPGGYTLVESTGRITVPFEGFVYADFQTGAVVRIEMKCTGIPAKSEYRILNLTLDYKAAKVAGREYLLPSRFNMRYEKTGNGAVINAEYRSYRRFSADSTVNFGDDSGDADVTVAEPVSAVAGNKEVAVRELPAPVPEPTPQVIVVPLKTEAPAASTPDPVFRSETKLVQVSVIAQDKRGKPVADLRREDFRILDNGVPQQIQLFLADTAQSNPALKEAGAPNTFTNQLAAPAGSRSGYSVILFDGLVTGFGKPLEDGTSKGRLKVLQTLHALPEGEKIALYAVGRKMQVVREFTTDRESLEQELGKWKPPVDTAELYDSECGVTDPDSQDGRPHATTGAVGQQTETRASAECVRIDMVRRLDSFEEQLKQVADHLAGIPGRKNLIWMANRFPIVGGRAVQRLMDAGVAIYPVDEAGVCRLCPPRPIQQMRALAELTGGVPFFERNDLDVAVREAIDDGRVSYTLGFYQSGDDKTATIHELTIKVNRPNVTLRYRTAYETEPPQPVSANPVADLVKAMDRPIDATSLPISVTATHTAQGLLNLTASFDVSSLGLELSQGLWTGKTEIVARFMTADGVQAGDVISETMSFNLRPATYAAMQQNGAPWRKEITVPANAVELKVLVGSLVSGRIGTLTIPLSEVKAQ